MFQSTSSVWRTTSNYKQYTIDKGISIHVLRVEDDMREIEGAIAELVSIHVLRVEDDLRFLFYEERSQVSIHVLRVEDDSKNREKSLFAFI